MPKIETPEEFVSNQIIGQTHKSAVINLTARDAAIRAEQAELLKMCGEALDKVRQALSCPEGTRANFLLASASLDIKNALAALKEAGVYDSNKSQGGKV